METDFAEDSSFRSQRFLIRENCIKHAIKFSRESFPERFFHGATSLQNALNFFPDSAFRKENFSAEIFFAETKSTNETNDRTIFIRAAILILTRQASGMVALFGNKNYDASGMG
jgi:hypothetical protein